MVSVMEVMVASFKRTYASTVVFSASDTAAGQCQPTPQPKTPGHSTANLAQSLAGSLLPSPGSWCAQGFVCDFQESVSQVLWKLCD